MEEPLTNSQQSGNKNNNNNQLKYFIHKGNDAKKTRRWRLIFFIFFYWMFFNIFVQQALYIDKKSTILYMLGFQMKYLTTLSFLFVVVYLLVGVIHTCREHSIDDRLTKVYRILQIIAPCAQLLVFIFYWTIVAPTNIPTFKDWCGYLPYCHFNNITVHGLGLLPTWLPLFIEPTLIVFKDWKYPILYLLAYAAILVPVTLVEDQAIYPGLTLKDVKSYIICGFAFLLMFAAFILAWKISEKKHKYYFPPVKAKEYEKFDHYKNYDENEIIDLS